MKIKVIVKPNAKHEKIEKISENEFRVWVKAPPIDNKANEAVINALSSYFHIPKYSISLVHGSKGKTKLFDLHPKK